MSKLEYIEWTNIWFEDLENTQKKRILAIGDSITAGYKQPFRDILDKDIMLDTITTSRAVDNPLYLKEIFYMLDCGGKYDKIIFNNGLHGLHLNTKDYAKHYKEILEKIMEKCPNSKLLLLTSTPITMVNEPKNLDPVKNEIVIQRNVAVEKIAENFNLKLHNNYSVVCNNHTIKSNDGYHYNNDGYKLIAENILKSITL